MALVKIGRLVIDPQALKETTLEEFTTLFGARLLTKTKSVYKQVQKENGTLNKSSKKREKIESSGALDEDVKQD